MITTYKAHTLSFPARGLAHSCPAFIDPHNLCDSSCTLTVLS